MNKPSHDKDAQHVPRCGERAYVPEFDAAKATPLDRLAGIAYIGGGGKLLVA